MISVDTNVLIRFLVADDRVQYAQVRRMIESLEERGETALVTLPVLCELAWTLRTRYRYSRAEVHGAIDALVTSSVFAVEREAAATRALAAYRNGRADFPDYLIGEISRDLGADRTVTFDRDLKGAEGFQVLA